MVYVYIFNIFFGPVFFFANYLNSLFLKGNTLFVCGPIFIISGKFAENIFSTHFLNSSKKNVNYESFKFGSKQNQKHLHFGQI